MGPFAAPQKLYMKFGSKALEKKNCDIFRTIQTFNFGFTGTHPRAFHRFDWMNYLRRFVHFADIMKCFSKIAEPIPNERTLWRAQNRQHSFPRAVCRMKLMLIVILLDL